MKSPRSGCAASHKRQPRRPGTAGSAAFAWLAAASAALLQACSLAPVYERPPAPVAPTFPNAGSASGAPAARPAADLPWAEFVKDARQRALVEMALANNRDLRVAVLNVEQTRAAYGVQRADRLPSVGVGATGQRTTTGTAGGSTVITSIYTVGLSVTAFELDLFGRVRNLSEAALARYFASDEGRRAAQIALIAGVVNADLALRADDDLLRVTQRALATREEGQKLITTRFEGGISAEPELRNGESLVAAARVSLIALQRQRSLDLNALTLLVGQPLPDTLPALTPLDGVAFADLPAGVPSEVLLQRPDVRQAEQLLVASTASIGAARAAFFPRISLTGSVGTASTQLSGLFENAAWSFAPQIVQPLFDAGRNQANLDATRAARDIAVAQYERAVQTAFREVADTLAGRATLGDQLAAQRVQAGAETRRQELAELLFRGGVASPLDRLDAERSALAARQAVVQVQLASLQNAVLLYRVLGGGAGPSLVNAETANTAMQTASPVSAATPR